jgi:hypothetical protein
MHAEFPARRVLFHKSTSVTEKSLTDNLMAKTGTVELYGRMVVVYIWSKIS